MPLNQFNDYEPPVSGGTIPIKLPGSYPGYVPQPRGHNPSPLPPPTDYYVTRKEVRDLLAKYPIETLMKLVENATDGNLVTLGADGQVIDSQVNISELKAIVGDDPGKSARAIATEVVSKIVDGAPEALDTLKEAADIIERLTNQGETLQTELEKKADKVELPYRLIELPIGETQLQNRTVTHITEKNIVGEWRNPYYDIIYEASMERYNPDTQSFGEGDYYYTIRIPKFPNHVFVSQEKVSDIFLETYQQTFSPVALADNTVFSKIVITPTEISTNLLGWNVSSPSTDGGSNHYLKFKFISQSDGTEYEAELRDYVDDYWGERYQWTMEFQPRGYCYYTGSIVFSGENVPAELEEQSGWTFEFDTNQYGNLKFNPGDTVSLTTWDVSGYDIELTFPNEELVWTRLDMHFQNARATVSFYGYNENGEEEELGKCEDIEITVDYSDYYVSLNYFECYFWDEVWGYYLNIAVDSSSFDSDEALFYFTEPLEVGKPLVLDGVALENSSVVSAGAWIYAAFEGEFSFNPPQQDGDRARDFLLCFDIPEPAPVVIEGVIEADQEALTIPAGRTLVSITEPIAGVLYASSRTLPTEEDA